ncbi:D123-domain-containing protein, partial [Rhodotorula sp. JG-1b]
SVFPPLYTADVLACQFSSWYPRFRRIAPKATTVRPLPEDEHLIDFLEADGLFLPEGSGPMGSVQISELSDSESEEEEADDDEQPVFSFPRLDAEIRSALEKYDGAVFPKLNWSSPQDAAWMLPGQNLKCQTPADVYLLLKSSDFISHDLDHAFEDCVDFSPSTGTTTSTRPFEFELVLKKWFDMPKSQEWRCFVRQDRLLGISQRDTTLYDFLQPEQARTEIRDLIRHFWEDSIRDHAPLHNYVLDVYITRDQSRVFVIDFNPYGPRTDPLLFSYPELHHLFLLASAPSSASSTDATSTTTTETAQPELRVVTPAINPAAQSAVPRYAHNRYPKDVVDMSEGQSIAEFAKQW